VAQRPGSAWRIADSPDPATTGRTARILSDTVPAQCRGLVQDACNYLPSSTLGHRLDPGQPRPDQLLPAWLPHRSASRPRPGCGFEVCEPPHDPASGSNLRVIVPDLPGPKLVAASSSPGVRVSSETWFHRPSTRWSSD